MLDLNHGSECDYARLNAPPQLQGRINALIDSAMIAERIAAPKRDYLGASRIGEPCSRRLAYEVMNALPDPDKETSGQTYRIFEAGHVFEDLSIRWLRVAGFALLTRKKDGGQFGFSTAIRSKHGRFLAIPTQYVIRRQNKRLTPADFAEAGIPLRYVPPPNGVKGGARHVGLLVVDNFRVTSKGKARVASPTALKTGRGLATIVMFILIPQASLKKRFDIDSAAGKWSDVLPRLVVQDWHDAKD